LKPPRGLFVTGTDTGVGKTYVTCLLARQLQQRGISVGIYKPVCSGAEPAPGNSIYWPDVDRLHESLHRKSPEDWICPQKFAAPLAPPVAARREDRTVDSDLLRSGVNVWNDQVDVLLVEGVGGWKCPLTDRETVSDLARALKFPVLVVAANRLGMISQTLLTLESVTFSGLHPMAAVVNSVSAEDDGTQASNADCLKTLTDVPIMGPLAWAPSPQEGGTEPVDRVLELWLASG